MKMQELRKLSRTDLLEILIAQMKENEVLQKQVAKAKELLAEREIAIASSGTMAEAALKLSGMFAAADEATKLYRENIERTLTKSSDIIREAEEKAATILQEAEMKAQNLLQEAEAYCIACGYPIKGQEENETD